MAIRRFNLQDDLAVLNNFWSVVDTSFSVGKYYNPETHDLIPKRSFTEQQLKFKEKCLSELKERRKGDMMQYDEQEKDLRLEIDQLKQKLSG